MSRLSQKLSKGLSSLSSKRLVVLSEEEQEMEEVVESLLYDSVVLGIGGQAYGLKWRYGTADDPKFLTGGWLYQANKDQLSGKKERGKLCFFILDDKNEKVRQCKDESGTYNYRQMNFKDIKAVQACRSPKGVVYVRLTPSKGNDWFMMPIQRDNDDIVVRWVAALRHRGKLFSDALEEQMQASMKIALWLQSIVRMRKAIEKADRRRERRQGLLNQLNGMWYGYEDTDSENELESDDEEDVDSPSTGSFFSLFVNALVADLYDNTLGTVDPGPVQLDEKGGRKDGKRLSLFKRRSLFKPKAGLTSASIANPDSSTNNNNVVRSESFVQDVFTLAPLQPFEIEDEIWENQRWQLKHGWSEKSLLPTDRSPFSDRIGRGNWTCPEDYPTPTGWEITQDWQVDTSGQVSGLCGVDGFTYSIDFPPLDSDLARGNPRISGGMRSVVRHRRYFRRRLPERKPRVESFVIWHGWLGMRSAVTGRWHSRYFVLTRGLRLHGKVTGVALSCFRSTFMDHLDVVAANDLETWNNLSKKDLKTFNLDGALVIEPKDYGKKSTKSFGFEVRTTSPQNPTLTLNADTSVSKENWIAAINHAVKDQVNRFTLTKSLDLSKNYSFMEIPQYENIIVNRLMELQVDKSFSLLFFDKSFEDAFVRRSQYKVEETESWSKGKHSGSRRRLVYLDKKRSHIILKQKVVRAEKGQGYQIDMSLQSPTSAWGNIYQDEIRLILSDWKGKFTRLCVTHRVQLRSEDETVRTFVESNARRNVLEMFCDRWLPLVKKSLKDLQARDNHKSKQMTLSSPSGIAYKYDPNAQSMRADGYAY